MNGFPALRAVASNAKIFPDDSFPRYSSHPDGEFHPDEARASAVSNNLRRLAYAMRESYSVTPHKQKRPPVRVASFVYLMPGSV
ncbi:hypothetical protein, partial [Yersinia kristensenii]|uniref:hypothetical protein n=1 Tax=Yersinia kristensenii TaxID=28152 RepID=UPI001C3DF1D1